MTTDYKNLSRFEAAAIVMIAVGIALIGFQFFTALPEGAQNNVVSALQVFEMSEPIAEVWSVQTTVYDYTVGGMGEFYEEFYVALGEIGAPVVEQVAATASTYANIAHAVAEYSDTLALNYQNNYVQSGVETSMGGRVMGAFIDQLSK